MDLVREFRQFVVRGNVVDLAVAVVIGAAFGSVVTAAVRDLLMPLIAAAVGTTFFGALSFTINGSEFPYGDFLNVLVAFLAIAALVFFLVVRPINALAARMSTREPTPAPTTRRCPECVSEIARQARRCPYCTSPVEPAAAG